MKNWFPYNTFLRADVAQLVEHNLAKVGVAGSNPVVRSITFQPTLRWRFIFVELLPVIFL